MYPLVEIFILIVWLYLCYQVTYAYFKLQLADTRTENFTLSVTLSTAVLFVLPIFIGTLIKGVL